MSVSKTFQNPSRGNAVVISRHISDLFHRRLLILDGNVVSGVCRRVVFWVGAKLCSYEIFFLGGGEHIDTSRHTHLVCPIVIGSRFHHFKVSLVYHFIVLCVVKGRYAWKPEHLILRVKVLILQFRFTRRLECPSTVQTLARKHIPLLSTVPTHLFSLSPFSLLRPVYVVIYDLSLQLQCERTRGRVQLWARIFD